MQIINIHSIVTQSSAHDVTQTNLFSGNTLIDAELIFWDLESSHSNIGNEHKANKVSRISFEKYEQGIFRRKYEFDEFFQIGRCLIITSPYSYKISYIINESGESKQINIIDCLPLDLPTLENTIGKNIEAIDDEIISNFISHNKKRLSYQFKIKSGTGIPLMKVKDTKYVVSEFYHVDNGLILLLPQIVIPLNDFIQIDDFLSSLINLVDHIKEYKKSPELVIPEWTKKYQLKGEHEEQKKLTSLLEKRQKIEEQIRSQERINNDFQNLKILFSGHGTTLEIIVERILKEFGFNVLRPDEGRDDLIIKKGNKVAVIEIKGVTKSAAEKHAAQLEKWVSNYYAETGANPKGILIVNTFKSIPVEDRRDDFPHQMLKYSKQRSHTLITTLQLLCMYLDFKNTILSKAEIVSKLFDTEGVVNYTNKIEKYITKII